MKIMQLILLLHCFVLIHSIKSMNIRLPEQFFIKDLEGKCLEDDFEWVWDMSYICCRKDNVYGGYKIIRNGLKMKFEEFSEESHAKSQWQSIEKTLSKKNKQ